MSEEERRQENKRGEQSLVNKAIDKAQGARRGRSGKPSALDKAVDKAQESGLVDKLADRLLKGRRGRR